MVQFRYFYVVTFSVPVTRVFRVKSFPHFHPSLLFVPWCIHHPFRIFFFILCHPSVSPYLSGTIKYIYGCFRISFRRPSVTDILPSDNVVSLVFLVSETPLSHKSYKVLIVIPIVPTSFRSVHFFS